MVRQLFVLSAVFGSTRRSIAVPSSFGSAIVNSDHSVDPPGNCDIIWLYAMYAHHMFGGRTVKIALRGVSQLLNITVPENEQKDRHRSVIRMKH